ncbi:MAG: hypothetical protein ACPG9K_00910 [Poseidonibacter sp.]
MSVITTKSGLALTIYAETLASFERKNIFMELVTKQTIESGKSAQFIINGRGFESSIDPSTGLPNGTIGAANGGVQTHALGANQRDLSSQMVVDERTIVIERPLVIRKELDAFEEKMAHYNIRSMVTGQNGSTMANHLDRRVLIEIDKAFNQVATDTQYAAGGVFNSAINSGATAEAKGDALLESIFGGASVLDGKDQIGKQRYFVTSNVHYYNLLLSQKAVNRDFNAGDNGSISEGNVFKIGDTIILRSNNLMNALAPSVLGKTGFGDDLVGYMLTEDAIGMVEFMGLTTKEWFDDDYDQTVMKTQLAGGWGVLNPGSLVAITSGTVNT